MTPLDQNLPEKNSVVDRREILLTIVVLIIIALIAWVLVQIMPRNRATVELIDQSKPVENIPANTQRL